MLRNVFVLILGKVEKGLEFVANPQNRTKLLFGSHVKNDFVSPTNHQIVGFYGILWYRKRTLFMHFIRLYFMRRLNQRRISVELCGIARRIIRSSASN